MQEVTHRAPRAQLSAELQSIIEDVEALISATASETGEKASNARAKVKDALEKAKTSYDAFEGKALAHARATDQVIRRHPYETLGIAVAAGLFIGLLINRR